MFTRGILIYSMFTETYGLGYRGQLAPPKYNRPIYAVSLVLRALWGLLFDSSY
jgi:hypothetical protein